MTVEELKQARYELQSNINGLLRDFSILTGYAVDDIQAGKSLSERYYNGVYTELSYLSTVTVNIEKEFKYVARLGLLVASDTWIDGDSNVV